MQASPLGTNREEMEMNPRNVEKENREEEKEQGSGKCFPFFFLFELK